MQSAGDLEREIKLVQGLEIGGLVVGGDAERGSGHRRRRKRRLSGAAA